MFLCQRLSCIKREYKYVYLSIIVTVPYARGPCLSALSLKNRSGSSSLYVHSFTIFVWNVHKAIHFALGHRRNVTCQIQDGVMLLVMNWVSTQDVRDSELLDFYSRF